MTRFTVAPVDALGSEEALTTEDTEVTGDFRLTTFRARIASVYLCVPCGNAFAVNWEICP